MSGLRDAPQSMSGLRDAPTTSCLVIVFAYVYGSVLQCANVFQYVRLCDVQTTTHDNKLVSGDYFALMLQRVSCFKARSFSVCLHAQAC